MVAGLGLVVAPASGCTVDPGSEPTPEELSHCAQVVGPEGGTMSCGVEQSLRIVVPPGALLEPLELTVDLEPSRDGSVGPVYEIGPSGTRFAAPVRLELSLGEAASEHEGWLALSTEEAGTWRALARSEFDRGAGVVSGETWHLSPYAAQPGAVIDMLAYVLPRNLCEDGSDRSRFRQGRGIIATGGFGGEEANGEAFFYYVKNDGGHSTIRGFEEWSVDDDAIYILSDYTWAGGEGEFVCGPEGSLSQQGPGRGECMDDPSRCGPVNDFAWTRYYEDGGPIGAPWLPRWIDPSTPKDSCHDPDRRCLSAPMTGIRYVGQTMKETWPWLDPATAAPRCDTTCQSGITSPPATPQSRDLELVLYGPGHEPCASMPEGLRQTCDGLAGRAGSLPAMILAYVRDGFGADERYWYGYGEGWVAYQRHDGQAIERRDDGAWTQHPEWVLPGFDCRDGSVRPGSAGALCGLIGEAPPEPPEEPDEPDPNEPDPDDPDLVCISPLDADACEVAYEVWTCVDELHAQRTVGGACEQDCCTACAPGDADCVPSECVGAPLGSDDGCRSDLDLACDPDARDGTLSAALPGAVHPDGLALDWPFASFESVEVMQAYGRWSWGVHKGLFRTSASNDEYALDLRPVTDGDPTGTPVRASASGVVRVAESPTDEQLAQWQAEDWAASFSALGRRVVLAHCDEGVECPGVDDVNVRYYSLYSHLDEVGVVEGDVLVRGQVLGTLGATGATGGTPHVHFVVYRKAVDCEGCVEAFISAGETRSVVGGQAVVPEPMGTDTCLRRGQVYEPSPCEQAGGQIGHIASLAVPDSCCDGREVWPGCERPMYEEDTSQWDDCGIVPDFSTAQAQLDCGGPPWETSAVEVATDGTFCVQPLAESLYCNLSIEYGDVEQGDGYYGWASWDPDVGWDSLDVALSHWDIGYCCH